MTRGLHVLACLVILGCSGESELVTDDSPSSDPWSTLPPVVHRNPDLQNLPAREEQYRNLCSQERSDSFFHAVCTSPPPVIPDLANLIRLVGLDRNAAFALTGNSTSLVMPTVSAVNPRAIIFPRVGEGRQKPTNLTILGFVRGEPFVEVVSRDTVSNEYHFYLFTFERQCDYESGCDLTSLLTEEIERGWTAYSIYTEQDLQNTPLDCLSCHQPGGHGTPKILRMQELESPWLHWFPQRFAQRTVSDRELTPQFLEAHAVDTAYAGILVTTIQGALDEGSGAHLEALLVAEGQTEQPNVFDPRVQDEAQDGDSSPTWEQLFAQSLTGNAISVPYPRPDVTDPALRSQAVQSYVDVVTGAAPRASLFDLRDLLSDDARLKLGLVPPREADGHTVLLQACSRCHDGRADPTLTKSAFNVKRLDQMTSSVKGSAIERMRLPEGSPLRMPPPRTGSLPPEAIEKAVEVLSQ